MSRYTVLNRDAGMKLALSMPEEIDKIKARREREVLEYLREESKRRKT